jgi:hypothetical protein
MALASGQQVTFDGIASMIAAGSAAGRAVVRGASTVFPRASQLYDSNGDYPWDAAVIRFTGAGSAMWTSDPVGTPNASLGMPIFANDLKPLIFPGHVKDFKLAALAAGSLSMVFLQGADIDL